MRTVRTFAVLLTLASLLAPIVIAFPPAEGESGRAQDIEIVSFDVPDVIRVETKYMVTAAIRNNGQASVQNLTVTFRSDGRDCNWSTVPLLEPGDTVNVTSGMYSNIQSGSTQTFGVEAGGATMTVQRLVRAMPEADVDICNFTISPKFIRTRTEDVAQRYTLTLLLINTGENVGSVHLTISVEIDDRRTVILDQNYSVHQNSPQNVTAEWVFRSKADFYYKSFLFRAVITGDIGETPPPYHGDLRHNVTDDARIDNHLPYETRDMQIQIVITGIALVCILAPIGIFLEMRRLKNKERKKKDASGTIGRRN